MEETDGIVLRQVLSELKKINRQDDGLFCQNPPGIQKREKFSGNNSCGSNADRRDAAAFPDQQKGYHYKSNTDGLFYQLRDGRNFSLLQSERIAAYTAVNGSAWQRIGDNNKHFAASDITQKMSGHKSCILLDQNNFQYGERDCEKQCNEKGCFCLPVSAERYFPGYRTGKSGFDSGGTYRMTQSIDGKNKLIQSYIFLAKGMT